MAWMAARAAVQYTVLLTAASQQQLQHSGCCCIAWACMQTPPQPSRTLRHKKTGNARAMHVQRTHTRSPPASDTPYMFVLNYGITSMLQLFFSVCSRNPSGSPAGHDLTHGMQATACMGRTKAAAAMVGGCHCWGWHSTGRGRGQGGGATLLVISWTGELLFCLGLKMRGSWHMQLPGGQLHVF